MNVDVVVPVYNEQDKLAQCVHTLREHLERHLRLKWRIVVADNASTDRTLEIAKDLAWRFSDVGWIHLDQKGRGRALKAAWSRSDADVLSYMDVDLSTDLEAFVPMIEALARNEYQVASGSRLQRTSQVTRSFKREVLSRGYNLLVWLCFPRKTFSDTQIGFKAINRAAADKLLPLIQDNYWFFDTELLVRAQRCGFRILDVPVRWVEDSDSRVKLGKTALDNVKGLVRLRLERQAA